MLETTLSTEIKANFVSYTVTGLDADRAMENVIYATTQARS